MDRDDERRILDNDLRVAIHEGQFRLAFQPVVDAATEDLVGFEALLRWSHPARGLLPPADFLPQAQAGGLMPAIGEWVVRGACAEAAKWPGHLLLSINLSLAELEDPRLTGIVAGALGASELDPGRLELDVGEPALLAGGTAVPCVLSALKTLGVRLALDDFGQAEASLAGLKAAGLDRLKIDPSLLRAALPEGNGAAAVLSGVVELAHDLGLGVTFEGVETIEEFDLVRQLGCTDVQGYLFGRPMTAGDALRLARSELFGTAAAH